MNSREFLSKIELTCLKQLALDRIYFIVAVRETPLKFVQYEYIKKQND